jgi:hypothetical protein
MCITGEASD